MTTTRNSSTRTWEIVSGLALLLVLAGAGGTYLRHRADNQALAQAIDAGDWQQANRLLKRGANPRVRGEYGDSLLFLAARTGDADLLRVGLERGLDPNAVDHYRLTPLMWAASHGSEAVVEALLAAGVDVGARTPDGYTALTLAAPTGKGITVRDPVSKSTVTFHRPTKSERVRRVYQRLRKLAAR